MRALIQHVQSCRTPLYRTTTEHGVAVRHVMQCDRRALLLKLPITVGALAVLDAAQLHQVPAHAAQTAPPSMQPPYTLSPGTKAVQDVIQIERAGDRADLAAGQTTFLVQVRLLLPSNKAAHNTSAAFAGAISSNTVAILSPGFLVQSTAYDSYLHALLELGVPAVTYDVQQSATDALDDLEMMQVLQQVLAWCDTQPLLKTALDQPAPSQPTQFFLCGHSRGGKISMLAALADSGVDVAQGWVRQASRSGGTDRQALAVGADRIQGLMLMDPADGSFETLEGPRFPSAARMWGKAKTAGAKLPPLLVVGAGRNRDCIPAKANYNMIFQEAGWPAALVVLRDVGHFSMLDYQTLLQQSVCSTGKADAGAVRSAVAAMLQLWAALCSAAPSKQGNAEGTDAHGLLGGDIMYLGSGAAESDQRQQEVQLSRELLSICNNFGLDAAVVVAGLEGN